MASETTRAPQAAFANRSQVTDRREQADSREKQPHRCRNSVERVSRSTPRYKSVPVADCCDGERECHQCDIDNAATSWHWLDGCHRGVDEVDHQNPGDDAADVAFV